MTRDLGLILRVQLLILLAAEAPDALAILGEGVNARLPAGGSSTLSRGATLQLECQAFGANQLLAVWLYCPLTGFLGDAAGKSACFENCNRPMCASLAGSEACRQIAPELPSASCAIDKQPSASGAVGLFDITVTYRFENASQRLNGDFTCQYKQMRSNTLVRVIEPTTTTEATTAITSAATTTATSSTSPSTTIRTTTSTTTKTTTSPSTSTTTKTIQKNAATSQFTLSRGTVATETTKTTAAFTTDTTKTTTTGLPATAFKKDLQEILTTDSTSLSNAGIATDWFNAKIFESLTNGHVLVASLALLILLVIVVTVSIFCCRCCFTSRDDKRRLAGSRYRPPPQGRASTLGSIDGDGTGALLMTDRQGYHHTRLPASRSSSRPGSAHSFISSPIYNEPDVTAAAAAAVGASIGDSSSTDYYARPNPPVPGSFFSRSQDGRHSFHSVRPANRQRIDVGGGSTELLSGGRGIYGAPGTGTNAGVNSGGYGNVVQPEDEPESVRRMIRMLTEQGREIQRLNQQMRASQQVLNRLAASYQDLHRSVSTSRVRHPSASPRNSPIGGRPYGAAATLALATATTPDSSEDPYESELAGLLPSTAARMAADAAAMAASAAALGDDDSLSPQGDADSTDGLSASSFGYAGAASVSPSGTGVVEPISEETEGEDATLRPKKQQQQQQQQLQLQ